MCTYLKKICIWPHTYNTRLIYSTITGGRHYKCIPRVGVSHISKRTSTHYTTERNNEPKSKTIGLILMIETTRNAKLDRAETRDLIIIMTITITILSQSMWPHHDILLLPCNLISVSQNFCSSVKYLSSMNTLEWPTLAITPESGEVVCVIQTSVCISKEPPWSSVAKP